MTKKQRDHILKMIVSDDPEICELGLRTIFMNQKYSKIVYMFPVYSLPTNIWPHYLEPAYIFETEKYLIVRENRPFFRVFSNNILYRQMLTLKNYPSAKYIKIEYEKGRKRESCQDGE